MSIQGFEHLGNEDGDLVLMESIWAFMASSRTVASSSGKTSSVFRSIVSRLPASFGFENAANRCEATSSFS